MSREKFEALPEIAEKINYFYGKYLHFCEDDNVYMCMDASMNGHENAIFVNGAYYAFCEQQKKIDSLLDAICGTHEDFKNDRARND